MGRDPENYYRFDANFGRGYRCEFVSYKIALIQSINQSTVNFWSVPSDKITPGSTEGNGMI